MLMKCLGVAFFLLGEKGTNLSAHPTKLFSVSRLIIAIITCIAICRDVKAKSKHFGIDNDNGSINCSVLQCMFWTWINWLWEFSWFSWYRTYKNYDKLVDLVLVFGTGPDIGSPWIKVPIHRSYAEVGELSLLKRTQKFTFFSNCHTFKLSHLKLFVIKILM